MMKIDGGCHCGAIRYEAEIDPELVGICHCTDCQTLSGSAFRGGVTAPEGGFRIIAGTPKIYVKTTDAGTRRAMGFCADCGTHIYSAAGEGEEPRQYRVRVGTARQRGELAPRRQVWTRSALSWLADLGALPGSEKQEDAGRL